ncbi:hypothetical protein JYT87_01180 [Nitrospira defluvii]|nr:hypothetical protein [Nitrospira defluvii]
MKCDTNEFNDAILNLVSNARSAMPNGGKLIIETMNRVLGKNNIAMNPGIVPGDYVLLSISDTGRGMTKAIQSRIFEPFFTTKSKEKGTGLGLSMVYGFVKRYGGYGSFCPEKTIHDLFKASLRPGGIFG